MTSTPRLRAFPFLILGLALAGCTPMTGRTAGPASIDRQSLAAHPAAGQSHPQEPKKTPDTMRQLVDYSTTEPPGSIVVDTKQRFVYLVQEGGKAIRYGVGVGREGMEFTGSALVGTKREWPRWTPTPNMIRREPEKYAQWAKGMNGGPENPLGARALYLFKDGKDTLFRIHGTNEPESIGHAVSSGCIRMMNEDIIDLYRRVPAGSRVVVR